MRIDDVGGDRPLPSSHLDRLNEPDAAGRTMAGGAAGRDTAAQAYSAWALTAVSASLLANASPP